MRMKNNMEEHLRKISMILVILISFTANLYSNTRKNVVYEGKKVLLMEGLDEDFLNYDLDNIGETINNSLPSDSRNIGGGQIPAIPYDKLKQIIESVKNTHDIPDLSNLDSETVAKIMSDFPENTFDEVFSDIEKLAMFYQKQVSKLVVDKVIEELKTNKSRSLTPYGDGEYNTDDDLYHWDDNEFTEAELMACLKHPLSAAFLLQVRDKAFALTAKVFNGKSGQTDNRLDAFRHAALNVLLARMGVGLKFEKIAWAKDIGKAHEAPPRYNYQASEMDLHNNAIGVDFYRDNSTAIYMSITKVEDMYVTTSFGKIKVPFGEVQKVITVETAVIDEPSDSDIINHFKKMAEESTFIPSPKYHALDKLRKEYSKASPERRVELQPLINIAIAERNSENNEVKVKISETSGLVHIDEKEDLSYLPIILNLILND